MQLYSTALLGGGMELYQVVVAGSVAGAIGIGVAYPFDTIKTKQVLLNGQERKRQQRHKEQQQRQLAQQEQQQTLGDDEKANLNIPLGSLEGEYSPAFVTACVASTSPTSASAFAKPSSFNTRLADFAFGNSGSNSTFMVGSDMSMMTMDASGYLALKPATVSDTVATALTAAAASASEAAMALGILKSQTLQVVDKNSKKTTNNDESYCSSCHSIFDVMVYIWQNDGGITGFFGGVQSMMIGQAIIKALSFSVNAGALQILHATATTTTTTSPEKTTSFVPTTTTSSFSHWLDSILTTHHDWSDAQILLIAAASAGFLASFVTAPVERICCILQAQQQQQQQQAPPSTNLLPTDVSSLSTAAIPTTITTQNPPMKYYTSEWACLQDVIAQEGFLGWLFGSGWTLSLLREMPSDMIYFALYGWLIANPTFFSSIIAGASENSVGCSSWMEPLVYGAMAGMASWIPVYPVDVVKTIYQTQPNNKKSTRITTTTRTTSTSTPQKHQVLEKQEHPQKQEDFGKQDPVDGGCDDLLSIRLSPWDITQQLWQQGGWSVFYEGMDAKLIRAAVHHAITFCVFDAVLKMWR